MDKNENKPTYGMCLYCGAIEVALDKVSGYRDFSGIGEHSQYPVGLGCELCGGYDEEYSQHLVVFHWYTDENGNQVPEGTRDLPITYVGPFDDLEAAKQYADVIFDLEDEDLQSAHVEEHDPKGKHSGVYINKPKEVF